MVSLIACWSFPVCAAWLILSYLPSSRKSILAKRLPRLRPTLRVWAVVIVILAVDFAMNTLCRLPSGIVIRFYVCDTTAVLLSVCLMMLVPTSPRDLWAVAFSVGLIGLVSMPPVDVR